MSDDGTMPEYLPGDTVTVEVVVSHEANIEDIAAWFTRQSEEEAGVEPEIFLMGKATQISREGEQMHSQAVLEEKITHRYLPGEYRLRQMTVFSDDGARHRRIPEVPDIRFRILPEPKTEPKIIGWEVY